MQQQDEQQPGISVGSDITALYDRYGRAIFAYARLHTPTREEAEDITLEVFTAALEQDNLAGLPESECLAWLRRVAHNKLVDHYRRFVRRPVVALQHITEPMLDADSPEKLALKREQAAQLHQSFQALSTLQQHVLKLHYGDGLRFTEIAILLNKREEAIRKIHSRALASLRVKHRQYEKEGEQSC
jgi:RNA polymerase sigma-70 factor (ECF subfamily)